MGKEAQESEMSNSSSSSSIQVSGLHFAYEGQCPFIVDFNLNISSGSRCLLVGANGSGAFPSVSFSQFPTFFPVLAPISSLFGLSIPLSHLNSSSTVEKTLMFDVYDTFYDWFTILTELLWKPLYFGASFVVSHVKT